MSIVHLITHYNSFLVYCRELAPGTVSLTGDRAQIDDSKHGLHLYIIPVSVFYCRLLLKDQIQQNV